jgi:hypothetical protein
VLYVGNAIRRKEIRTIKEKKTSIISGCEKLGKMCEKTSANLMQFNLRWKSQRIKIHRLGKNRFSTDF